MTVTDLARTGAGTAAKNRFGTVLAAVEMIGIRNWPRQLTSRLPSPGEVLAALKDRYRSGQSMRLTQVIQADRRLMHGAYKHFGTWRSALRAAGIPYDDDVMTRAQVKAELRARQQRREPVSAAAIQRDDPALWSAVLVRFGSLSQALRAATEPR